MCLKVGYLLKHIHHKYNMCHVSPPYDYGHVLTSNYCSRTVCFTYCICKVSPQYGDMQIEKGLFKELCTIFESFHPGIWACFFKAALCDNCVKNICRVSPQYGYVRVA